MEERFTGNEPTTGEIVRALRFCTGEDSICGTACPAYSSEAGCRTTVMKNAADRLESQEREIGCLQGEMFANALESAERIATLTARAEQAERERDAAIAEFNVIAQDGLCEVCFFGDFSEVSKDTCMEDCCFQWRSKKRGLAQKGDADRCRVEF